MPDVGRTILAFCWSQLASAESYLKLANYVRKQVGLNTVFLSDHPGPKLQFISCGYTAFTISELAALNPQSAPLDEETRTWLTEFDRRIGYNDFTPETLVAAYHSAMDLFSPCALLTWNGAMSIHRAGLLEAGKRGVPCFYLERGLLPGTLVVDPEGVNYGSHIAGTRWAALNPPYPTEEEKARARAYCEALRSGTQSVVKHGESLTQDALRAKLKMPQAARYVLLPLQIEWDSNIVSYSPHFKTMPDVIKTVQAAMPDEDDLYLLVKPHPEDKNRLDELRGLCGPQTRLVMDVALRSLLHEATAVVTLNSTVGLEALTEYKPVVTLANAIYGEKGFTYDIESREDLPAELRCALDAATAETFNEEEFLRFLVYLLKHCLFSLSEEDPWGSRENIAAMIGQACKRREPVDVDEEPMAALLERNEEIRAILHAEREYRSVLLLGGPYNLLDHLQPICPRMKLQAIARTDSGLDVMRKLSSRYDVAFRVAQPGRMRDLLWPLVRAKRKIALD